jgi:hypothetical protein
MQKKGRKLRLGLCVIKKIMADAKSAIKI